MLRLTEMHSWLVFLLIVVFSSCTNETSEKTLSKEDHAFIESLGILEPKEEIELFESNG
ncbi:MAG: hypothetical protein RI922_940, partial [Bacteroidota bacterium]